MYLRKIRTLLGKKILSRENVDHIFSLGMGWLNRHKNKKQAGTPQKI